MQEDVEITNITNHSKLQHSPDDSNDTNHQPYISIMHHSAQQIAPTVPNNESETMRASIISSTNSLLYEGDNKWTTYITNPEFYGRLLILIILFLLLSLSIAYCIAQLISVKLSLVQECTPKTREEIWHHSYLSSLINNEVVMTAESQHGLTSDACWTTNAYDTNTDQLWYSNNYIPEWHNQLSASFILFMLMSIYCALVIICNILSFIQDIYFIKMSTLHYQSTKYQHDLIQLEQKQTSNNGILRNVYILYNLLWGQWTEYMGNDTTGWIIRNMVTEIAELFIQTQALLLYNGYNIMDADNQDSVYLANKPEYIVIFSCILAMNAFGSGSLWISYAVAHKQCHGLTFKLSIFFIDQISDLLYTIFPFILVLTDSYNEFNDNNVYVILGQLNTSSGVTFISAWFPLFMLCTRSLLLIRSAVRDLRNAYYKQWKFTHNVLQKADDKETMSKAFHRGYLVNKETLSHLSDHDKELYDTDGHLMVSYQRRTSHTSWIDRNKLDEKPNNKRLRIKQSVLISIAMMYIVFGITVLIMTIKHVKNAKTYCGSIQEQNYIDANGEFMQNISLSDEELTRFAMNPELFLWDHCLYKTYPFTINEKQRCQCRVFVVDWSELTSSFEERVNYFNLTQSKMLSGMLEHWIQLEKFFTKNVEKRLSDFSFTFTSEMFKSVRMKAFEWNSASITSFETGISAWKELEYLRFQSTSAGLATLPVDFGDLHEMKYLSFIKSGISTIPTSICNLTQLNVLQIEWEPNIRSIPHCIHRLHDLRVIFIDGSFSLNYIPLSMFNLPQLVVLSLFKGSISYDDLLEYNLPDYIDIDDVLAIDDWMNDSFAYKESTKYYLSENPICTENMTLFPSSLEYFLTTNGRCDYLCSETDDLYERFCAPRLVGDGRCDEMCNLNTCYYDDGDCIQLCFAPELTNCSWDLATNQQCDAECKNKYCTGYEWGSTFETTTHPQDMVCSWDATAITVYNESSCDQSIINNVYIDRNLNSTIYDICAVGWIGDGECDDSCRTKECGYDLDDCSLGCVSDVCNSFYQIWLFFGGGNRYIMSHEDTCADIWPTAMTVFGVDAGNCSTYLDEVDYNKDKYLNFREFVPLAYGLSGSYIFKGAQLNCSECVGMQNYNIQM